MESMESIMKYGLRKPGEKVEGKVLQVVEGHIPLC